MQVLLEARGGVERPEQVAGLDPGADVLPVVEQRDFPSALDPAQREQPAQIEAQQHESENDLHGVPTFAQDG